MIIASTAPAAAQPYTPSWLADQPDAATFYIRAGDVIEREMLEAQLSGPAYGAGEVWPWEKQATLLDGLGAIGGEDAAQLIALAQASTQAALDDPAERGLLEQAVALVAQHYPPYRMLIEQEGRRRAVLPVIAFCRYVVRWENVEGDVQRGVDGLIDPATLSALPPLMMRSAGFEAYNRQYAVTARKNSDAPSKSGADPRILRLDEPSEKDGSSGESITLKIPA